MKEKKGFRDILFLILFCATVLFFAVGILIIPKQTFSEKENRVLADAPQASVKSVLSGAFFDELSTFYSDHIPFRTGFTSLHAVSELSIGKMQSGDVIRARNGALVATKKYENEYNGKELYDFLDSSSETYLYVAPRSIDIFKDSLPSIYSTENADKAIDFLKGDTLEDFNELILTQNEALYYKTDHHWTTDGAYFAYMQICQRMDIEAFGEDFFTKEVVSVDFYGTSFSKSGLPYFMAEADRITLYRYEGDGDYRVLNRETAEAQSGFYSFEALEVTDKYKIFMGGNYSHLSITESSDTGRERLLLIKDSYANCVIPFLALHFDIEVIDPRYCTRSYVKEQIENGAYDKILILLGVDTLVN